jgi:hypothetical protein
MIRIILEEREHNFDGTIDSIRKYAWFKVKEFKKKESRKKFLYLIYRTIQAMWTHGQRETSNGENFAIFIHCDPATVAKLTKFTWALDKAATITKTLALSLGYFKDTEDHDGLTVESYDRKDLKKVRFRDDRSQREHPNDRLAEAMDSLAATIVNQNANRESLVQEDSWAYKAIKLASSKSKTEPASEISPGLRSVIKHSEKTVRETSIARNINQLKKANFRIDKTMATSIRSSNIFRESPELTGRISIFHCFPQKLTDSQEFTTGAEMDAKLKAKAISAKSVQGQYESKLGIAQTGHELKKQFYNFWKFNCFMFGDEVWLTKKMQEIYKIMEDHDDEINGIEEINEGYILRRLAGLINNEYHHFLSSCVDADGDMDSVGWSMLETLVCEVRHLIRRRSRPDFIINTVIQNIADQSKSDYKRKLQETIGGNLGHTGHTLPRKQRQQNNHDYQREKFKREAADDNGNDSDRENFRKTPKLNKQWKMSVKEFRRVITPNTKKGMPMIGERSICAMYNIVGRCVYGAQCHHSHEELTGEAKAEFEKWLSACKEEANAAEKDEKYKKKNKD